MRILLDENIDPGLIGVLVGLRHEVVHVADTVYRGQTDQQLIELAEQFDVFITLDLHRQEPEWLAVHQAMVEGRIRVLRLRLPKDYSDPLAPVVQSVAASLDAWLRLFESGKSLVTVRRLGRSVKGYSREEIRAILAQRGYRLPD